jgi:membrane protein DedA with SNARE-associated domain
VDHDPPSEAGAASPVADERTYSETVRRVVLALCVARYVVPIVSLLLLPGLLREDVADGYVYGLFAVRPGREVMLFAGYLFRLDGRPSLVLLFLAGIPFFVAATWVFFLLGRVYRSAIREGTGPAWLARLAPAEKIEVAQRALARRGPLVAFIVRVGGLPPTLVGAAAGVSDVRPTPYLVADAVGSVVVFALTVGIGYGLGETYTRSGPWFTGAAVIIVLALSTWFSSWVQREFEREGIE